MTPTLELYQYLDKLCTLTVGHRHHIGTRLMNHFPPKFRFDKRPRMSYKHWRLIWKGVSYWHTE